MNKVCRGLALATVILGVAGCKERLGADAYRERYESECAVTVESGRYAVVGMYASPEYLAVITAGPTDSGRALDSLARTYTSAHYVRVSVRPLPGAGDDMPGRMEARNHALSLLLRADAAGLRDKIRLSGPGGRSVAPLAVTLQSGTQTGSANTLILAFPRSDADGDVDPGDWPLVIDDFGLNLGTLRVRLVEPKRLRLKVAA